MRALCLACALSLAAGAFAAESTTLAVPPEQVEAVWSHWKERHPGATATDELWLDDYYDDTKLHLLGLERALRHHGRWFGDARKHGLEGRELLQLLGKGEVVDPAAQWFSRPPQWQGEPDENVPGLQLISRGDRGLLAPLLAKQGIDAQDLVHVLQVEQRRRAVVLEEGLTATLVEWEARKLWWSASFAQLELEAASPEALERARADLLARFPDLRPDTTPTYRQAFDALDARALGFRASAVVGLPVFLFLALPVALFALLRAVARKPITAQARWR